MIGPAGFGGGRLETRRRTIFVLTKLIIYAKKIIELYMMQKNSNCFANKYLHELGIPEGF